MPREYPAAPIVAVAVVLLDGDRVLLVRRGRPPAECLWSVPGGAVEPGETLAEAARRELQEETGLDCDLGPLVEVVERITRDESGRARFHYVILDLLGTNPAGTLRPGSDAGDARFVGFEELAGMELTEGLIPVIERARGMRDAAERERGGRE